MRFYVNTQPRHRPTGNAAPCKYIYIFCLTELTIYYYYLNKFLYQYYIYNTYNVLLLWLKCPFGIGFPAGGGCKRNLLSTTRSVSVHCLFIVVFVLSIRICFLLTNYNSWIAPDQINGCCAAHDQCYREYRNASGQVGCDQALCRCLSEL
jgi:hypothetical protein